MFACAPTSLYLPQAALGSLHIETWALPDQQVHLMSQAGRDRESVLVRTQFLFFFFFLAASESFTLPKMPSFWRGAP